MVILKKMLAGGLGVLGLCAICCALPIIGITGLGGVIGIGFGYWKWGLLLIALAFSGFLISKIVKRNRTCNANVGCNCSSGSCKHS